MAIDAGQPEIFRAVQRDEAFQKHVQEILSNLTLDVLGIQRWVKWRRQFASVSKLIYYAFTSLQNLQTLGEEYTGIVHWTDANSLPTKQMQTLMVLLDCFGEQLTTFLLTRCENLLTEDKTLRPEAKDSLLYTVNVVRSYVPIFSRMHKALFYIYGRYYHVSKRLTGIRYAMVRFWLRDRTSIPTFRLLGALTIFNEVIVSLLHLQESTSTDCGREICDVNNSVSNQDKCSLCLNNRLNSSATPCGHLFCWDCILPWLNEQQFCPLCRQSVLPSRVVFLKNL